MSADPTTFLDQPQSYWMEVCRRMADELPFDGVNLINEIATLRSKVAFYESRIEQMHQVMRRITPP